MTDAEHPSGRPEVKRSLEPGSFRDRQAQVFYLGDQVFRALSTQALRDWESLESTAFFRQLEDEHLVVHTRRDDSATPPGWVGTLHHERIDPISYPFEWPFSMLKDAALLHLRLLREALAAGFSLKDATPYNIQWIGTNPIFIDVSSFIPFREGNLWAGYRQFCELFLNPLLLHAYKNIPFQPWLRGDIDGIKVADCAALMSSRDFLRKGVLKHVMLHAAALKVVKTPATRISSGVDGAGSRTSEMILSNLSSLENTVRKLESSQTSSWMSYATDNTYDETSSQNKESFVRRALETHDGKEVVIDFGCNTGSFSRIASENARTVVAVDTDHASVEQVYLRNRGDSKILPLLFDLANPSPGLGWNRQERQPLEKRLRADAILALALIHHLVIGRNVPLSQVLNYLASFRCPVVLEWVERNDPMVETLLLQKNERFDDYQSPHFKQLIATHFIVNKSEQISPTRVLYHLIPRC